MQVKELVQAEYAFFFFVKEIQLYKFMKGNPFRKFVNFFHKTSANATIEWHKQFCGGLATAYFDSRSNLLLILTKIR